MSIIKIISFILISIISISCYTKIFALTSTYVFCVNSDRDWHWLVNEDNKFLKVNGFWRDWVVKNNIEHASFSYFVLENAMQKLRELSEKCKKKFGDEYYIPQPANYNSSYWNLFAINQDMIFGGFVEIKYYYKSILLVPNFLINLRYFKISKNFEDDLYNKLSMIIIDDKL